MKKMLSMSFLCLLLSSCSVEEEEKDPNLLSEWKLIETYQSDGSQGKYLPTDRNEIVKFYLDSTIRTSSSWCSKHGTDLVEYSAEENIIVVDCEETPVQMGYEVKGNLLFIYPSCAETCVLKYIKIDSSTMSSRVR